MATSTSPRFDWEDPFLLRDQLTEEERMVTDSSSIFSKRADAWHYRGQS